MANRPIDQSRAREAAEALRDAGSISERRERVRELMLAWSCSERTVYRLARSGGWSSGRRTRADKGQRSLDREEILNIQSMVLLSKRKSKHCIMNAETALDVAATAGMPIVSVSTYNRYLREDRLNTIQMEHDLDEGPHINMVSLHPNHVHQFDITNCTQYYFNSRGHDAPTPPQTPAQGHDGPSECRPDKSGGTADGSSGRKLEAATSRGVKGGSSPLGLQHRDMKREFYIGKPEKFAAIKKHLLRFVLVDHFSNSTYVKYFYTSGERAIDVAEFLLEAWGAEGRDLTKFPFRGVPKILVCDKGSAAMSGLVSGLLEPLGVERMAHLPGNPRAKGSVEGMMRIWERNFESRLALHSAPDLETLNAWTRDYLVRFNSEKRLVRAGRSRSSLWLAISPQQLRLLPPSEVCRELLATPSEERTVRGNLTISFKGSLYRVPNPDLEGRKVTVSINPYRWTQGHRAVDVTHIQPDGTIRKYEAREVMMDEAGRITGERTAIFGETYNRHPDTITQKSIKQMQDDGGMSSVPAEAVFGNHASKVSHLGFLPRAGEQMEIKEPEVPTISRETALLELSKALGRPLLDHEAAAIELTPNLTTDQVRRMAEEFLTMEMESKEENDQPLGA